MRAREEKVSASFAASVGSVDGNGFSEIRAKTLCVCQNPRCSKAYHRFCWYKALESKENEMENGSKVLRQAGSKGALPWPSLKGFVGFPKLRVKNIF